MTFEQAMIHTLTKENDKLQVEIGRLRQALERQSCEDCISRAKVQKFVSYIQSIKDSHNEQDTPINYGTICDLVIRGWKLMELPSVTPILPKYATNGDVIKAMFPEYEETRMYGQVRYGSKEYVNLEFVVDEDWWDAPYEEKRGNKE